MLGVVGKPTVESLFAHIPERLRATRPLDIEPLDENSLLKHLGEIGARSRPAIGSTFRDGAALSFLGAGVTPHVIPAAVDMLLSAQRVVHELHAVPARDLAGHAAGDLRVPDDRVRALRARRRQRLDVRRRLGRAEAVLMARRLTGRRARHRRRRAAPALRRDHRLVPGGRRSRARTSDLAEVRWGDDGRVAHKVLGRGARQLRRHRLRGRADARTSSASSRTSGALAELAHARGALLVVANTEPVAFGVLQSPGALGADIVVGEGLGLGNPADAWAAPASACSRRKDEYARQMPGRLVGETVDKEGRRGYVLTLATREQHIRREKATSNICTNQGLIALAFTIHMSLLGKRGLASWRSSTWPRPSTPRA